MKKWTWKLGSDDDSSLGEKEYKTLLTPPFALLLKSNNFCELKRNSRALWLNNKPACLCWSVTHNHFQYVILPDTKPQSTNYSTAAMKVVNNTEKGMYVFTKPLTQIMRIEVCINVVWFCPKIIKMRIKGLQRIVIFLPLTSYYNIVCDFE